MSLNVTQKPLALGTSVYVQGDQRTYTVGPFLDDAGRPLRFDDDTVTVILRLSESALYVKHAATNPTLTAINGISTDGQGRVRFTLFSRDVPVMAKELRLQVSVQRTFNDSQGNPKKPYTQELGEGDVIVRPAVL